VQGRTVPRPQSPPASKAGHQVKSLATGPLTRGRAVASSKGKRVVVVLVQALAKRETPSRDLHPFVRGSEPRRGVARGLLVVARVGGSLFLWGKTFDAMILTFRCLCTFSGNGFSYAYSSFLRLKRLLE